MRRLRTYNTVWKVEKTIYSIEGVNLPVPLSFRQMGFFVGTVLVMIVLNEFPPVRWIDLTLIKFFGIPILVSWFCTRKTLDGKAPHRFFIRYVQHYVTPQQFARYKAVPSFTHPVKYDGVVVYRHYPRSEGGHETDD